MRPDRRARVLALALLAAFAVIELGWRRTPDISVDFAGWRQCDTQTIARNFAFVDANIFYPRIDWGGDGPGYVESELQLYTWLYAPVLRLVGPRELPGQLMSLASLLVAFWVVFAALEARFGSAPALTALALMLGGHGAVNLGTSIQPDPFGFALFAAGFVCFLRFVENGRRRDLGAAAVFTALAGLVKPTLLQLGLVEVALVALRAPALFRRRDLWLAWGAVLAVVVAFLLHARHLHLVYGNSFGSISGGDSKFPRARDLVSPSTLLSMVRMTIVWGTGWAAVAGAVLLAWKRRLGAEEKALAVGALAMGLVALRYSGHKFGEHYHIPSAVLGAWLVARAVAALPEILRRWHIGPRTIASATVGAAIVVSGAGIRRNLGEIHDITVPQETPLGHALAPLVRPGELIVVRSRSPARDDRWETVNNFEDPRVFYLAHARGWVLPSDLPGAEPVAEKVGRGARHYVEPTETPAETDPALTSWLAGHARLVVALPEGRIFELR